MIIFNTWDRESSRSNKFQETNYRSFYKFIFYTKEDDIATQIEVLKRIRDECDYQINSLAKDLGDTNHIDEFLNKKAKALSRSTPTDRISDGGEPRRVSTYPSRYQKNPASVPLIIALLLAYILIGMSLHNKNIEERNKLISKGNAQAKF